jgi:hypothetical protein
MLGHDTGRLLRGNEYAMADLLQIVLIAIVMDAWKVRWSSPRMYEISAAIVAPLLAATPGR